MQELQTLEKVKSHLKRNLAVSHFVNINVIRPFEHKMTSALGEVKDIVVKLKDDKDPVAQKQALDDIKSVAS